MDRGAWRVTVHGIAQSRTWLKQLSTRARATTTLFRFSFFLLISLLIYLPLLFCFCIGRVSLPCKKPDWVFEWPIYERMCFWKMYFTTPGFNSFQLKILFILFAVENFKHIQMDREYHDNPLYISPSVLVLSYLSSLLLILHPGFFLS